MPHASPLASEKCQPCKGGDPALAPAAVGELARELGGDWRVVDHQKIEKRFEFPDFARGLAFTNLVGALAEEQGHHPDLWLRWGSVTVQLWTHAVGGLSRADFVLAAKIDALER